MILSSANERRNRPARAHDEFYIFPPHSPYSGESSAVSIDSKSRIAPRPPTLANHRAGSGYGVPVKALPGADYFSRSVTRDHVNRQLGADSLRRALHPETLIRGDAGSETRRTISPMMRLLLLGLFAWLAGLA